MKGAFVLATVAVAEQPSFEEWKAMFQVQTNGADEEMKVKYDANVAKIEEMNAENNGASFAVNQFAAMDGVEWKAFLKRSSARDTTNSPPVLGVHSHDGSELAASVNWVTSGAVTGVKDQGQCGGCWSFAATGGLEGTWQVATGTLTSLAEQQFLDCSASSGCAGGLEYNGWNYFKSHNQGICTESSYPYMARNGACQESSCTLGIPAGSISGVTHVQKGSASALQSALNSNPVAIGIEADQSSFQFYSGGVLTAPCGTNLDHSVLAVGYDTANSYWLVKNSWGASWGDSGYIKLTMSSDECGILDDASFPVVAASVAV
jgi:C1A family cysteine protease